MLYALLVGLLIGAVAKLLMPGRDPGGCIVTTLIGIAGSAVGTYLGQLLGFYRIGQPAGFVGAVLGAMFLLLVYRVLLGKRE